MDAAARALALGAQHILGQSGAAVSHTGDTAEFTLASVAVPANPGVNARVAIRARFSWTNSANVKTPKIKFGGTVIETLSAGANTGAVFITDVTNRGVANSQDATSVRVNSANSVNYTVTAVAVDTTAATTVDFTGQLASSGETITLESYSVILYPI